MFLGQESKYNGKFRPADSKNLPKSSFFHQKSMKIIGFSWFSLSELVQRSPHAYRRMAASRARPGKDRPCSDPKLFVNRLYASKFLFEI